MDLSTLRPGEPVGIKGEFGPTAAVFLGVERGLAQLAVTSTNAPFYVDPVEGNMPHLRRAVWTPRRVRPDTIVATWADVLAERDARRAADEAAKRHRAEVEERKWAANKAIAEALSGDGVQTYAHPRNGVEFYGEVEALEALAERVTRALAPVPA
jgi:hypothetical protein